jgi:hypothetical protein
VLGEAGSPRQRLDREHLVEQECEVAAIDDWACHRRSGARDVSHDPASRPHPAVLAGDHLAHHQNSLSRDDLGGIRELHDGSTPDRDYSAAFCIG